MVLPLFSQSFEAPHDFPLWHYGQLGDEQLHTAVEQRFVRLLQAIHRAQAVGFNLFQPNDGKKWYVHVVYT